MSKRRKSTRGGKVTSTGRVTARPKRIPWAPRYRHQLPTRTQMLEAIAALDALSRDQPSA